MHKMSASLRNSVCLIFLLLGVALTIAGFVTSKNYDTNSLHEMNVERLYSVPKGVVWTRIAKATEPKLLNSSTTATYRTEGLVLTHIEFTTTLTRTETSVSYQSWRQDHLWDSGSVLLFKNEMFQVKTKEPKAAFFFQFDEKTTTWLIGKLPE